MISSRSLDDLHPKVKILAELFVKKCAEYNIEVQIISTYRDIAAQNALYAKGRTAAGNIVTNAKGGQSFHNHPAPYSVAFDFLPFKFGKPDWTDIALYTKCGEIAEEIGLEWAGRWKTFKEYGHCQFTDGLTLADFRAGKTL
jgi:peptidoglycan L-alanyl-D-glutamate endopeptidase CwlK